MATLLSLREGRTDQANQLLEQHLARYVGIMCNSYDCLSPTNRERVKLESLEKTRDYYAKFPPPEWGAVIVKGMDVILKPRKDAETEKAINEFLRRNEKPKK